MNTKEARKARALVIGMDIVKKEAKLRRASGVPGSHCQVLNLIVKELGFNSWNEYCSYFK